MLNALDRPLTIPRRATVPEALRRAFAANPPLMIAGLGSLGILVAALVGLVADPTVITGAPAWLKPLKFAISTAVYAFTFLWLLTFVQGHARLVRLASWGTAIGFVAEMVLIVFQVVRGRESHFNVATPLDAFIFERMRDFIIVVFTMGLIAAVLLLRQRLPDRAFAASLRFGIGLALVGMLVAVLMTVPTPATSAAFEGGRAGAHSVGVADGGPGLPLVGWSTVGGDLRIAHFVGLHAMQILPLLGWALGRRRFDWLGADGRLALVRIAGFAYLGLILLLTWQALRGQPLIAPDGLTLAVAGALLGTAVAAAGIIVLRARSGAARLRAAVA
jgi:hypothetical protein